MTQHVESEVNKRFRAKFDFEKYGFYSVTPYTDVQIGFGCKKKLNAQDTENVSGIGIYIPNKTFNDSSSTKKALYIGVTYGKEFIEGIQLRSEQNFWKPTDLEFRDDFFYDIVTEKFYKGNKEINANDLLVEVYTKHIKTTLPIRGLLLRFRLNFWRIWLPRIPKSISYISHYLLYLISGDRYIYEFLFQEETLNGQIISSRMEGRIDQGKKTAKPKEEEKEAKQIDFFGNKVPQWPIVFYSVLHLCIWFSIKNSDISTKKFEEFFGNNFLLVLYVIVSFWTIETVIPFFLKKSVKYSSTLAFHIENNSIKV